MFIKITVVFQKRDGAVLVLHDLIAKSVTSGAFTPFHLNLLRVLALSSPQVASSIIKRVLTSLHLPALKDN